MTLLYKPAAIKRNLAFAGLALSLLLSAGCKKSGGGGDNSSYYIKFKLSGVQKNFQQPSSAIMQKISPYYTLQFAAAAATTAGNGEAVGIDLFSATPLVVNEAYASAMIPGTFQPEVVMSYGSNSQTWVSSVGLSRDQLVNVTITEMTDTQIKGTFAGGLVDNGGDPTAEKYLITEGEFNLKLSQ